MCTIGAVAAIWSVVSIRACVISAAVTPSYFAGLNRVRHQRFEDAVPFFEEAVAASPEDSVLRNALGVARLGLGNWEAALSDLEKARRDPEMRPVVDLNGVAAFASSGDSERAASMLSTLSAADVPAYLLSYARGVMAVRRHDPAAGLVQFESALAFHSSFAPALFLKASALRSADRHGDAITTYSMLLELVRDSRCSPPVIRAEALSEFVVVIRYADTSDPEDVLIGCDPSTQEILLERALTRVSVGDRTGATSDLEELLDLGAAPDVEERARALLQGIRSP